MGYISHGKKHDDELYRAIKNLEKEVDKLKRAIKKAAEEIEP